MFIGYKKLIFDEPKYYILLHFKDFEVRLFLDLCVIFAQDHDNIFCIVPIL